MMTMAGLVELRDGRRIWCPPNGRPYWVGGDCAGPDLTPDEVVRFVFDGEGRRPPEPRRNPAHDERRTTRRQRDIRFWRAFLSQLVHHPWRWLCNCRRWFWFWRYVRKLHGTVERETRNMTPQEKYHYHLARMGESLEVDHAGSDGARA